MITRRQALALPALALLGALPATARGAPAVSEALTYRIFREGEPIGRHVNKITRVGDKTIVDTRIDVEVYQWFLRVYTYRQTIRETWTAGWLTGFTSETDDNGDLLSVQGRATEAGFEVTTWEEKFYAPAAVHPASFWSKRVLGASHLIDTATGSLLRVWAETGGAERLDTPFGPIEAQRFVIRGDLEMQLWYARSGRLAKLFMHAREDGSEIEYYPATPDIESPQGGDQ